MTGSNFVKAIILLLLFSACSTPPALKTKPEAKTSPIDSKAIRQTILSHRRYIGDCYGKSLMSKGAEHLKGTMMIHFSIGPDGQAQNPKVVKERSTLHSSELSHCLIAGLKNWDFPVHKEGEPVSVNYPFVFRDRPPKNMQKKMDRFEKFRKRQQQ